MATPPLPERPVVRCRLIYAPETGQVAGQRVYLAYSGSAPSGADCTTLAGDVAAAWLTHLAPVTTVNWQLTEVDILDIATDSGFSGQWVGTHAGTRSGTVLPQQVATNVEFGIARRYRGGKPRMYLAPGVNSDAVTNAAWESGYITAVNSAVAAFFSEIEGLTIGSMGTLSHVNVSFYQGYDNIENPGSRAYARPKYRTTAKVDTVTGYSTKAEMSSQRRRRTSTTP